MLVKQVSVFLENKPGRLADVTAPLAEAGINIRALALADTSDFGVLRLIVDNTGKAEETLKNMGFTVQTNNVLGVEVEDKPGGLHRVLELILGAGINVEYMYAFVNQGGKNAVIIFRFDQIDQAAELLAENGIKLADCSQL